MVGGGIIGSDLTKWSRIQPDLTAIWDKEQWSRGVAQAGLTDSWCWKMTPTALARAIPECANLVIFHGFNILTGNKVQSSTFAKLVLEKTSGSSKTKYQCVS